MSDTDDTLAMEQEKYHNQQRSEHSRAKSAMTDGNRRSVQFDTTQTPDVSILRLNRRPPPPLPLNVFGYEWRTWVEDAAKAACCPPDYVAGPLLASASALVGNARWAKAWDGWQEPPHLWLASVGDSGDGKSSGADPLLRHALPELDRRMLREFPERHG
jgi:hypothetical protein